MVNSLRPHSRQDQPVPEYQPRKNYGGLFSFGGENIKCYTKKQMKSLYPDKDFEKALEYAPGSKKEPVGILKNVNMPLFEHGAHSRILYREKGFIALESGEDRYATLLQNVLLPRIAALMLCLALIVGAAVFAINLGKTQQTAAITDDKIPAGKQLDLEEGAEDWKGVRPQNTGGVTQGIAIPGFKSITIDADKKDIKVNFSNPEGNPCYFEISLLLEDGKELYKSKMIQPGKGLYNITLNEPLAKGEYKAAVKYETYSLDDLTPMNGAQVKVMLIAQ